jgi:tetratricopeptide (TPR) repeat protein
MMINDKKRRYQRLRKLSDGPYTALTIRYGRRYLADYPDHGPAWMLVGVALVELARYEEAEQAFAKAIEFCPTEKRQVPLSQMGHLFLEAGDYDQAAEWYRKAVDADPGRATYHIFLGAVLAKQGRFHEAESEHRAAIACPEGCIDEAYLNLGFVLRARDRFEEAAECFREAIRLHSEYRLARRALRDVERCIKFEKR